MRRKLDEERVLELHSRLEKLCMCRKGILHPEYLESAIAGKQWYDNIFDQYIHVGASVNSNHVFNDGNKRTCYMIIKELSEYRYLFDEEKLSDLIMQLGKSEISKEEFMKRASDCIRHYD